MCFSADAAPLVRSLWFSGSTRRYFQRSSFANGRSAFAARRERLSRVFEDEDEKKTASVFSRRRGVNAATTGRVFTHL
jgi:hypothetical protein